MINFRSRITLLSLFSVIFFAASLCGFKGLVLCYGSDGHIHTEITFNGFDCGHFPGTSSEQDAPTSLANDYHTLHANHCISCTDIPLSFDFFIKKYDNATNKRTASKVRTISSLVLNDHSTVPLTTAKRLPSKTLKHSSPSLTLVQNTVLLL